MVATDPCEIPSSSWMTFTAGAKQFLVKLAAVTMRFFDGEYRSWIIPNTRLSAPLSLIGADTTTF